MVQFDPQMVAQMLMQPIQRASENLGGGPFGIGADAGGSYFVDPEVAARTGYGTAVTGTSFFPGAGIVDAYGGAVDITGQPLPSFSENISQGQFTDAGLQALGVAGDIATIAAPLTGGATALLGAMMKAPGAARKVTKATDVAKSTEIRNLPNRVLHGTLVDNVDSIKKLGIVPDIGENVSFSYGEYEDLLKPFSFFSGTDDIDRSLSAIRNQVAIKLGKQASEVTDADIVKHGALVVSRVEDTGSIFRVGEGGETFTLADEKGFFDAPVSGETDDIVSSEIVKPSGILTGQKLKKFLENRKLIESTDVASDASKIDLPTDSSKVKNEKMLDRPKNPKNLLKYKGKETWGVIVDNLDNEVIGTVPFEKAQAADFHHSFYMSPKFIKKIDDGDYSLYVDNDDGFGLIEGKGEEVPPAVKKRILEQVEYFPKDD